MAEKNVTIKSVPGRAEKENSYVKLAHSINETARTLGISPGLVRLEIARGRLRPTRVARRVLIMREELDRYLAAGSSPRERDNG
jgi:excisionase family DNA binding protein